MLAEHMTLEKAREIAESTIAGKLRYGAQYAPPYRPYEILEAVTVLEVELRKQETAIAEMVPKEDLTKANRQLAALNARYQLLRKKSGAKDDQDDSNG